MSMSTYAPTHLPFVVSPAACATFKKHGGSVGKENLIPLLGPYVSLGNRNPDSPCPPLNKFQLINC